MRRLACLVLIVLLAGAARGVFETRSRSYEFRGADELDGVTEVRFIGNDSARLRDDADQDGDGQINASEERDLEEAFGQQLNQSGAPTFVDGTRARPGGVQEFDLEGLRGDANASTPINATLRFTLVFPGVEDKAELPFRRATREGDAGPWTVQAPPGYTIEDVSGLDNATLTDGNRTVTGIVSASADLEMTFTSPSTPGFGAALAVAAVVAAIAYTTRPGSP